MFYYAKLVYEYLEDWYYYFFCKDIQPYDAREFIDDDLVRLNRILHYYRDDRQKTAKIS